MKQTYPTKHITCSPSLPLLQQTCRTKFKKFLEELLCMVVALTVTSALLYPTLEHNPDTHFQLSLRYFVRSRRLYQEGGHYSGK